MLGWSEKEVGGFNKKKTLEGGNSVLGAWESYREGSSAWLVQGPFDEDLM